MYVMYYFLSVYGMYDCYVMCACMFVWSACMYVMSVMYVYEFE